MREPTDGQLAISALIVFSLWIFVALPLYYGSSNDAAAYNCSAQENKNDGFWKKTRCDPIAFFTASLVGFTGVLAVSTIGLWWTTWRGSERQSRDMTALERAFVAVTGITITTISQHGIILDYIVQLNVVNSGRTPALDFDSRANLGIFDAIPTNFRFPDGRINQMPAKVTLTAQMQTTLPVHLFIQDAVALHERRKKGLIWGWIEYNDIFPDSPRHRAEFCMMIEVTSDPRQTPKIIQGSPIPIIGAQAWGRYNNNDDNCLYRPGETPVAEEGELPPQTPPPEGITIVPA